MDKQILQTPKGFRDFLPAEAMERAWLKNKIISVFEKWGFSPLETPTLEYFDLFKNQIGADEKLIFKFEDQGGRELALRYDQTVPTCRVVAANLNTLVFPFKRYQIQSAFRAEKPQKGRYREFVQCDADIFGSTSPLADAEVIALSLDIYREIGFKKAKALINDRALLVNLPYEVIVSIDKLKKIGESGIIEEMIKKGIKKEKAQEYLSSVLNLQPNETIKTILEYLKNYGFDESWFSFEPTIARSFAYSSGPIWEIEIPDSTGGSVLGGERFDGIVEKISGTTIPGTGFGLGFDRTLEAAKEFGLIPKFKTTTKILVTIFEKNLLKNSLILTQSLREKGISTEIYTDANARLDKQLKYADRKGIPYVIIMGPEEIAKNGFILKNLCTKTQQYYSSINDTLPSLTK